jgi:hypothetical protein
MTTATEAAANIKQVEAVPVKGGYRIDAVMHDGSRETIKKKSTRFPTAVQLFRGHVNGNYHGDGIAQFFTFTKSAPSHQGGHVKGYLVVDGGRA